MTARVRPLALALTVPLLGLSAWMAHRVIAPVLIAALFAIVLRPLEERLVRALGRAARLGPAIVTVATLLTILAPAVLLGALTFLQLRGIQKSGLPGTIEIVITAIIRVGQRSFGWLARLGVDMSAESLRTTVEGGVESALAWLTEFATNALRGGPDFIVGACLFVIALYFWLRDGRDFLRWLMHVLPFAHTDTERLFERMREAAGGVILAQLAAGAAQAILALVALFALRVPGAFLLGILAFVLSFIPVFGTTPVTIGASIYLFASGRMISGFIMIASVVVVGVADNVVRPWIAQGRAHLHPLVTLVAIFGGLATIGPNGVLFGPMLATLAAWVLDYYGRAKEHPDQALA